MMGWAREKEELISVSIPNTLSHSLLYTSPVWIFEHYSCSDEGQTIIESTIYGITAVVSGGGFDPFQKDGAVLLVTNPCNGGHKCWVCHHTLGDTNTQCEDVRNSQY